jgi:hypothetical protein
MVKVNLSETSDAMGIAGKIAGGVIACVLVLAYFDGRLDAVESRQLSFEGVMQERTRNMNDKINLTYDIVRDWGPVGGKEVKEEK